MPTKGFRWLTFDEIEDLDISSFMDTDKFGYILEVDLKYPRKLHKLHNNFPLAPERRTITHDMTSAYTKEAYNFLYSNDTNDAKDVKSNERLTTTFLPRKNYVVHGMTLKKYLELGLQLTHVHRVLTFEQSYFLKQYVDFCTAKRVASQSTFGKTLWKFVVNSCFGKFIERVRDRIECKFVTSKKKARFYMTNPNFKSFQIINKHFVAIFLKPDEIYLNKPISIGFTILDRSKEFMFDQYYNHMKKNLNCEVLYGDTDSLFLKVSHDRKCNSLEKINFLMDYSNYPPSHLKYNERNKNALGFFKDELEGDKITKFVSLRSKSYSYLGKNQVTKLKGITKAYRKDIPFYAFFKCIKTYNSFRINQYHIRSRNHQISTDKVLKLALTSYDVNRYIMPCGVHTVPYGSYFIKKAEKTSLCPMCYNM